MALLTPREKWLAVYNADLQANGKPAIVPDDFDMSTPTVYSGPRSTKNTVMYLQPKASAPIIGLGIAYYNRIALSTLTTLSVAKGAATTLTELLPALNIVLGLNFAATDFSAVSLPAAPGSFTLTATATNIMFTGAATVALEA